MSSVEDAVIAMGGKLDPITQSIGWKEGYGFKKGFVEFSSVDKVDRGFQWVCDREKFEMVAKRMFINSPAPNWNGQGLPPVGTVCELAEDTKFLNTQREELTSVKEGSRIVVTGHSKRPDNGAVNVVIMVVDNLDAGSCVANPGFVCRPIKSDRDKWIGECAEILKSQDLWQVSAEDLQVIYDAMKSGKLPKVEE